MDLASLRNKIEWEGGVIGALEYGVRDDDIDDDDLSDMWYEIQTKYEVLESDIAEFEDELAKRINDADNDS